jgi:hypothetical protein
MPTRADLPRGSYVVFRVAAGTTAATLAHFLQDHGLAIEVNAIAFREENATSCLLSIPASVLCQLLNWAIDSDFLGDMIPKAEPKRALP